MEPLNCTVRDSARARARSGSGRSSRGSTSRQPRKSPACAPNRSLSTRHFSAVASAGARPVRHTWCGKRCAVAKATGMPVKVVWTREDDMHGGYYRPQWFHRVAVHTGDDGLPRRWDHTIVGQSILKDSPFESVMVKDGVDVTSVEGVADSPYVRGTPVHRVELHSPDLPVTTLWWRSVGHSHNAFVMESLDRRARTRCEAEPARLSTRDCSPGIRGISACSISPPRRPAGASLCPRDALAAWPCTNRSARSWRRWRRCPSTAARCACTAWCAQSTAASASTPRGFARRWSRASCMACRRRCSVASRSRKAACSNRTSTTIGSCASTRSPAIEVHIVPSSEKPGGAGEPGHAADRTGRRQRSLRAHQPPPAQPALRSVRCNLSVRDGDRCFLPQAIPSNANVPSKRTASRPACSIATCRRMRPLR